MAHDEEESLLVRRFNKFRRQKIITVMRIKKEVAEVDGRGVWAVVLNCWVKEKWLIETVCLFVIGIDFTWLHRCTVKEGMRQRKKKKRRVEMGAEDRVWQEFVREGVLVPAYCFLGVFLGLVLCCMDMYWAKGEVEK
jgi:hypothetical protein